MNQFQEYQVDGETIDATDRRTRNGEAEGESSYEQGEKFLDEEFSKLNMASLLAGVFTFGPVVLAVARVIGVSQGDPQTLLVLLKTLNVPSLIVTTLLSFGGVLIVATLLAILGSRARTTVELQVFGTACLAAIILSNVVGFHIGWVS